jgi:hypothetical protein
MYVNETVQTIQNTVTISTHITKTPTHYETHTSQNKLQQPQYKTHTKWNSHITTKYPQYKVTLMYMVLLSPLFTIAHFTSLQNKVTSHKSRQFTPHHFTYLHSTAISSFCASSGTKQPKISNFLDDLPWCLNVIKIKLGMKSPDVHRGRQSFCVREHGSGLVLVVSWVWYLVVSGEFCAVAALLLGKEIFGPILLEVRLLPEQVWILYLNPLPKSWTYDALPPPPIYHSVVHI